MRSVPAFGSHPALRAVAAAAGVAGVLDAVFAVIAYVLVLRAFSLVSVLQYIASGLVGKAAFAGALSTAALGVGVHFFIAAVWIFKDLLVLPLTGTPKVPFDAAVFASFLLDHAFFVGLPIALIVRRSLRAS